MAKKELQPNEVLLRNVRLSFARLWHKEAATEAATPKYSANFLIDPSTSHGKKNVKGCKAAVKNVKMDKWKKDLTLKEGRCHFVDGENFTSETTGEIYDGYEGMMVVSAKNGTRFPVVDADKTPLTEDDGKPYSGCYVNALVRFYAVSGQEKGGNGVFASLELVQFVKDGEAFGAGVADADDYLDDESEFEDEVEEDDNDDLT